MTTLTVRTYERWFIRFESSTWGFYRSEAEALEAARYSSRPFRLERETWQHVVTTGSGVDDIVRSAPERGGATPISVIIQRGPTNGLSRCDCGCKYWNTDRCFDCGERWRPEMDA